VKVGFFGGLTGADPQLGINIRDGEQLAISQYNVTNPKVRVVLDRSTARASRPRPTTAPPS
jgi:hypothetical protein